MKPRHDFPQPCELEFAALVKRPVRPAIAPFRMQQISRAQLEAQIPRNLYKGRMG